MLTRTHTHPRLKSVSIVYLSVAKYEKKKWLTKTEDTNKNYV